MSVAIVTGASGLIGSEAAISFADKGHEVVGLDNDMRATFFGEEASARWQRTRVQDLLGKAYNWLPLMELESRWEIDPAYEYVGGIPEEMPIDTTLHSRFGASKLAADVLCQDYGRY